MTDASKWLAGSVPFAAAVFGFLGVTIWWSRVGVCRRS